MVKYNNDGTTSLYVGDYEGLYRSTDGGASWVKPNNPPNQSSVGLDITALAIDSSNIGGASLFADTWRDGVFRTSDDGTNCVTCNAGLLQNMADAVDQERIWR